MPAGERPRHSGGSHADACGDVGGGAGARPGGPEGGSEGRATQQTAAWLSPAQHLGAGTSLLSFPGISREKACPPGGCQGPRATLALGGSGSGRPLGALRLCLCTSSPPRGLPCPPPLPLCQRRGIARAPRVRTKLSPNCLHPCSQASLEDKQDRGQDARGQVPEDAKVEEASTRCEQPAGGEGADECTPEAKVGRTPHLRGQPPAQPCPFTWPVPPPPHRNRSPSPSS